MRTKQEIENQLAHFKNGECQKHGSSENEIWITALEWVLGNEQHREAYAKWFEGLEAFIPERPTTTAEGYHVGLALRTALEHLR